MPIKFSKEPKSGREVVQQSLVEIAQAKGADDTLVPRGNKDRQLSLPIEVFSVELNNLSSDPAAPTRTGWQYIVVGDSTQFVELHSGIGGAKPRFAQIGTEESAEQTITAIKYAEQLGEVKNNDYTIRELRVPGLCFNSIWLSADDRSLDRFVPITPLRPKLDVEHAYTSEQIFSVLGSLAEQRLQDRFTPED